jgi:hypothetical protein
MVCSVAQEHRAPALTAFSEMRFSGNDPEVRPAPETQPSPAPSREDPRYPSHTPPAPQKDPSPVEPGEEEWYPACSL